MAKERLSKLQKWILETCYTKRDREASFANGLLLRREIVDGYFNNSSNKAEASTSRAIKGLMIKGLVIGYTTRLVFDTDKNIIEKQKPDMATLMARRYKEQGRTPQEFEKDLKETLLKDFKKTDKVLSPAQFKKDRIKVVTLSREGVLKVKSLQIPKDLTISK